MGRDTREATSGLDRNKYYKSVYVDDNKLQKDAVCQGVFYSTDHEPITTTIEWNNGTHFTVTRVKLETKDYVADLTADYFVLYNGDLWRVEEIQSADIIDNAKPFKRHSNKTIISLKR